MASKGDLTKERILSEATTLFHQKGFGATSVNDIIVATGIKKGSLYFHFSSKEEIGLAVLEQAKNGSTQYMGAHLVGETPGECLIHYFEAVYRKHKLSNFSKGCLFGNTALEVNEGNESYSHIVDGLFSEWVAGLQDVIAAAQKEGQVRDDIEANVLACHIVSTIEGGIMLSKLKKDGKPLRLCLDCLKVFLLLKN